MKPTIVVLIVIALAHPVVHQSAVAAFAQRARSPRLPASSTHISSSDEQLSRAPVPKKRLVIVGGGVGGLSSAYDARHLLKDQVEITVVSDRPNFTFVPSNPWVAVGKRRPEDVQLPLSDILPRHGIKFIQGKASELNPAGKGDGNDKQRKHLVLDDGRIIEYDYLIIATGPKLGFEGVPGLGEFGKSVCTVPHAVAAAQALDEICRTASETNPGPIVVGAAQGASCFGPAYEYALLVHHELNRRGGKRLLDQCPITMVTSEPWPGHLGLHDAGQSRKILTDLLSHKNIRVLANCRIARVDANSLAVEQLEELDMDKNKNNHGVRDLRVVHTETLPSNLTMIIPPFRGSDVWRAVPGLTDKKGMILCNDHMQSVAYPDIFGVGVCVHLDPYEITAVPTGMPKTGYMIESMGTAAVKNIRTLMKEAEKLDSDADKQQSISLHFKPVLNGLCITDFGDDGAIFVTMPQAQPRHYDWTITGKVGTLAKIAFEKYFLHKVESGDTDPYYEKYMLKLIGVERTKKED
jgi:NADH dehydrogenase FAD-containing subunit